MTTAERIALIRANDDCCYIGDCDAHFLLAELDRAREALRLFVDAHESNAGWSVFEAANVHARAALGGEL